MLPITPIETERLLLRSFREAATALIDVVFENCDAESVMAIVDPANARSMGTLLQARFRGHRSTA